MHSGPAEGGCGERPGAGQTDPGGEEGAEDGALQGTGDERESGTTAHLWTTEQRLEEEEEEGGIWQVLWRWASKAMLEHKGAVRKNGNLPVSYMVDTRRTIFFLQPPSRSGWRRRRRPRGSCRRRWSSSRRGGREWRTLWNTRPRPPLLLSRCTLPTTTTKRTVCFLAASYFFFFRLFKFFPLSL